MTTQEFKDQWDILYNNIASNSAPGLDDYEKSVFLTNAQIEIVTGIYNGTLGSGFENTESNRRYLENLVTTAELVQVSPNPTMGIADNLYNKSYFFNLPENLMFITYEFANVKVNNDCIGNRNIDVVPVKQDEFNRIRNNPFRGTTDNRILRLDVSSDTQQTDYMRYVELISKNNIDTYTIRYIRKPKPIILADLSLLDDNLSIEGITEETQCELNPLLHKIILETAVSKAYQIRPN